MHGKPFENLRQVYPHVHVPVKFSWVHGDASLMACDYSHFFAPDWTHKITVKSYLHAQNQKVKRRAFRRPGRIPLQKVENGRISLQEVVDDCNLTRLFSPRF